MNKEEDYASDSDESDEDFCPDNEKATASGDEEEDSASETEPEDEDADADADSAPNKRKRKNEKGKKRKEAQSKTDNVESTARSTRQTESKDSERQAREKDELESDEEADKSRSDALWADFLGDVGGESKAKPKVERAAPPTKREKPKAVVYDFAGESISVSKTSSNSSNSSSSASSSAKENLESDKTTTAAVAPRIGFPGGKRAAVTNGAGGGGGGGGLGSLLNQLGKKKKMSVLEKSQLDWKSFKSDEGIDEELRTHNKGRDGYLERQDFLQRTDLRQFEIEKNMRQTRRQH